jgi:hypothetical protein
MLNPALSRSTASERFLYSRIAFLTKLGKCRSIIDSPVRSYPLDSQRADILVLSAEEGIVSRKGQF